MNREEIAGKVEAFKGKAKQTAGNLTHDPDLVEEGRDDEAVGETRATVGKARRKVGKAIENIGKQIKK